MTAPPASVSPRTVPTTAPPGLRDERHVAGVEGVEDVLGALVQRRDVGSVDLGLGDERSAHGGGDLFGLITDCESDNHAVGKRGHRFRLRQRSGLRDLPTLYASATFRPIARYSRAPAM